MTPVANLAVALPPPPPKLRQALVIEKIGAGEWQLLEVTLSGSAVTAEKRVGHAYYRDLIEQDAVKHLRKLGRK